MSRTLTRHGMTSGRALLAFGWVFSFSSWDGLNLAALKDMTEGDGSTPDKFWEAVNKFGFTFNWGYISRNNVAFFSSGLLPVRPDGLARRQRGAARRRGPVDLLDAWVEEDAPRLDADNEGFNDHAGPTVMDALWDPLVKAAMGPMFGDLTEALYGLLNLGGSPSSGGGNSGSSLIDKDLRTLLGKEVEGKFNLSYCGKRSLENCRDSLWQIVEKVSQELAADRGDDPRIWLEEGQTLGLVPGVIPDTFRATNRPKFQQELEFAPSGSADGDE